MQAHYLQIILPQSHNIKSIILYFNAYIFAYTSMHSLFLLKNYLLKRAGLDAAESEL